VRALSYLSDGTTRGRAAAQYRRTSTTRTAEVQGCTPALPARRRGGGRCSVELEPLGACIARCYSRLLRGVRGLNE
jgi:hypothetical protein